MPKKKRNNSKLNLVIVLVAIVIVTFGIFLLQRVSITGFVVLTEEKTFDDNLNLVVNESKNVTWNIRNPGNLQLVKATGAISRNGTAKVYLAKDDEKLLIFDSTKQLFDVNVEVLPDYKRIFQGDELLIQIVLFNLRGFGSADVDVKYSIKEPKGGLIAAEEEIITVETQAKFVRKLLIPSDLKSGTYVAFVEVKTPDGLIGTSSDSFEVVAKFEEEYPPQLGYYIIGFIGVLILLLIIIVSLRLLENLQKKKKIMEIKEKIPEENIMKLKKELAALESAYRSKFISKESYKKSKERLEIKLKQLKKL